MRTKKPNLLLLYTTPRMIHWKLYLQKCINFKPKVFGLSRYRSRGSAVCPTDTEDNSTPSCSPAQFSCRNTTLEGCLPKSAPLARVQFCCNGWCDAKGRPGLGGEGGGGPLKGAEGTVGDRATVSAPYPQGARICQHTEFPTHPSHAYISLGMYTHWSTK